MDPIASVAFDGESYEYEAEEQAVLHAHVYISSLATSTAFAFYGLMDCIWLIIYSQALDDVDALRFLISFPGSIGLHLMTTSTAVIGMVVATITWVNWTYGASASVPCGVLFIIIIIGIVFSGILRSRFTLDTSKTASHEWSWAESENEEPPLRIKTILKPAGPGAEAKLRRLGKMTKEAASKRNEKPNII
eukprot:gnl/MRDRNA2_/MRDRNA2_212409_c0_seq1.p1 gnl/MRDRNA2_/MRDRNA2_212409_c0~~gnl/MRDRNA2_/MRDRNA2_212409_c0_seq1.p1  ORF type:complete len:221 (+),score=28.83 gnl/MRDRNA2_/MRDRNA2_212409_c0_seq1:91-663(+)